MKKKFKLFIGSFPLLFLVFLLGGCTEKETAGIKTEIKNTDSQDSTNIVQTIADKKLVIAEHKCSGCGKCVRIDPEHFSFDIAVRKAAVVSSENLNSQDLSMAISICRDRAIELM